jgi:hypothetical protein
MNHPSLNLQIAEFKFEMSRKIIQLNHSWLYKTVIKRSIGEDYVTEIQRRYFNDEMVLNALFLNENANRGGMPLQVEMGYDDFDTNLNEDHSIGNFNQKWNDSPIVAALANLGLAGISRAVDFNVSESD